jgi:hypothetical protein
LPPVVITLGEVPMRLLPNHPGLGVVVRGPQQTPYRTGLLGTKPELVQIAVLNATKKPYDVSGARIAFRPRRNGVVMACAQVDAVPLRESHWMRPGEIVVFERELCSLPLLGTYGVDVLVGFGENDSVALAGSFNVQVYAKAARVPQPVQSRYGVFVAMGGDVAGVRYTPTEWKTGTYHVVLRFTNAGTDTAPLSVGGASVIFRVTKDKQPLACSSTHDITLPPSLESGHDVVVRVPVTCLIDVKGRYEIDASLTMAGETRETPLGSLAVEVTSDPLLYLPQLAPW